MTIAASPSQSTVIGDRIDTRWSLALGAIVLLAIAVRLVAINQHSFWYDEAIAAELVAHPFSALVDGSARDNGNPPLYWVAAKAWAAVFGTGEVAMRSLPAIFGILTVPLIALLGRRLFAPSVGLLAGLLLAVSPQAVELSNEARVYALQQMLTVLSTLLLVVWIQRPSLAAWIGYGLSMFLVCYSHYYAFVLPAAHGLGILVHPGRRRLILPWLGAMVVAVLLWLHWFPVFRAQLSTEGNLSRMGDRWMYQFLATPAAFGLGRTFAWRDSSRVMLAIATLGSFVCLWVPALLAAARYRDKPWARFMLGSWWLAPILGPLVLALLATPLYHVRAGTVGLPAFLLLAAVGLASLRARVRIPLLAVMLALTAVSLYRYSALPLKDDWRSAAPAVLQHNRPGTLFVFDGMIDVASFKYYAHRLGQMPPEILGVVADPALTPNITAVRFADGQRVDTVAADYGPRILAAREVCLVLCVPAGKADQYEALFASHGLHLATHQRFHRVDVYRFTRQPARNQ